jgi:hypothetical protein
MNLRFRLTLLLRSIFWMILATTLAYFVDHIILHLPDPYLVIMITLQDIAVLVGIILAIVVIFNRKGRLE